MYMTYLYRYATLTWHTSKRVWHTSKYAACLCRYMAYTCRMYASGCVTYRYMWCTCTFPAPFWCTIYLQSVWHTWSVRILKKTVYIRIWHEQNTTYRPLQLHVLLKTCNKSQIHKPDKLQKEKKNKKKESISLLILYLMKTEILGMTAEEKREQKLDAWSELLLM